jgi:hypothetical protein
VGERGENMREREREREREASGGEGDGGATRGRRIKDWET